MIPIAEKSHARDERVRERIPRIPARSSRAFGTTPVRPTTLARPAFTLLEVMLAAVLGLLVIVSSLALFATMDRAKRLQAARLEGNLERQLAHRTIQQALRTLVMDSSPEPKDDELKSNIEKDIDDAEAGGQNRREDTAMMRFALQPDLSKRTALGLPMQTLDLTVSTPPIHAVSRSTDAEREENQSLRELALSRRRSNDVWNSKPLSVGLSSGKSSGKSSTSKDSTGSAPDSKSGASSRERSPESTAARSDRLRSGSLGLAGTEPGADRVGALAGQGIEAPRAPGLRGVFEFRPEDDAKVLARAEGSGGGSIWALWWKQIPVEDDDLIDPSDELSADPGAPNANATKSGAADASKLKADTQRQRERLRHIQLVELSRASRSDAPEIKLLSGLTGAQWQVYRRRKMVSKMAAMHAKELPAYVNLKFDTLEGRHEDWLFEIGWSYGQEPGTVMASNDPLGSPLDPNADAVAAAVQAALEAAGGGGPNGLIAAGGPKPGANGPKPGSGGPIVNADGPSGHPRPNGGGAVSGGNGRPIVITLPGGGTITIPAGSQPGGGGGRPH